MSFYQEKVSGHILTCPAAMALVLPTANNADELCRVSGGNAKYTTFGLNNFKLSIFVKEFLHI